MRRAVLADLPRGHGRIVRRLGRRLKPDRVGGSGCSHRGRCSRRGLDARRPAPLDAGNNSREIPVGAAAMKTRKSGSQKRKTTARIAVNCTPDQKDAIVEKARAFDQSPSAICLNMLLDAPLPRRLQILQDERMGSLLQGADGRLHHSALGNPARQQPCVVQEEPESVVADHLEGVLSRFRNPKKGPPRALRT